MNFDQDISEKDIKPGQLNRFNVGAQEFVSCPSTAQSLNEIEALGYTVCSIHTIIQSEALTVFARKHNQPSLFRPGFKML